VNAEIAVARNARQLGERDRQLFAHRHRVGDGERTILQPHARYDVSDPAAAARPDAERCERFTGENDIRAADVLNFAPTQSRSHPSG
jgi:hypothetical protein